MPEFMFLLLLLKVRRMVLVAGIQVTELELVVQVAEVEALVLWVKLLSNLSLVSFYWPSSGL